MTKKEQKLKQEKKIKRLKAKANRLYKEMSRSLKDAEETHAQFHKRSTTYANVLKQIEIEITKKI